MRIQINTDRNIQGHENFTTKISEQVESALSRFSEHITRVELHLSDENGFKFGENDKQCMIEARLEHHKPMAVTHQSDTLDKAIEGAIDKIIKMIENTFDRLHDLERKRTDPVRVSKELIL